MLYVYYFYRQGGLNWKAGVVKKLFCHEMPQLPCLALLVLMCLPACMNTSVRKREEEQSAVANSAFGKIY